MFGNVSHYKCKVVRLFWCKISFTRSTVSFISDCIWISSDSWWRFCNKNRYFTWLSLDSFKMSLSVIKGCRQTEPGPQVFDKSHQLHIKNIFSLECHTIVMWWWTSCWTRFLKKSATKKGLYYKDASFSKSIWVGFWVELSVFWMVFSGTSHLTIFVAHKNVPKHWTHLVV